MSKPRTELLNGRCLLVVEDEFLPADDLKWELSQRGAEVVGPAGSVKEALDLLADPRRLDGAVLDINLRGEFVYPVADELYRRNVPFVFATGYDAWIIPERYASAPRVKKPVHVEELMRTLLS